MNLQKPLLIYDGHCTFCRKSVERMKKITGDRVEYAPSQEVASKFPQITSEQFQKSVWLVEPDGRITGAAEAVFRALAMGSSFWRIALWKYKYIPGFAAISECVYRNVAKRVNSGECKV